MKIVERDALTVIGIPVRATWQNLWTTMPEAWRQFIDRHADIVGEAGATFVDVSLEKNDSEYWQLVGSQVSCVKHIPKSMVAIEIPAQQYIHYKHSGPRPGIAESFGKMYRWARQQGHVAGEFKLDIGYTANGEEREHDLFIGLLPEKPWRYVQAA